MANTLNVNAITGYTETHKDELLVKASADAKSLRYIDIMSNVKYKDAIPTLDSTIVLADGSACGFNPAGSDTFGQRFIESKAVKVEKSWCAKDFEDTFANYQLHWEAGRESMPYEEKLCANQVNLIQEAVEKLVWMGDSGLSINGLIADIKAESGVTITLTGATGETATNLINAVVAATPAAALKKGVNVFVSYTLFRKYVAEQNGNCCGNRSIIDAALEEMKYVGDSRINIVPVQGLEDASNIYIVAAPADAMVYATDIENAHNTFRFWYDEGDDMFNFRALWRSGTALRYPEEVVLLEA